MFPFSRQQWTLDFSGVDNGQDNGHIGHSITREPCLTAQGN
ncbi:hypothetical protein [Methanobacterium sp.]|nr:hypothetical protein [Methanobacterium sp.]